MGFMLRKTTRCIHAFLGRFPSVMKSLGAIIKYGGYVEANISFIKHGQLLSSKHIIITGGSTGIGLAIAKKSINEGANVLITGRSTEKLASAAREISSDSLKTLVWDVASMETMKIKTQEAIVLLGGRVDILINNAGILLGGDFPHVKETTWDEVYKVNSKGTFFLCQEVCSHWLAEPKPRVRKILNISSQGGFVGATYPYRMTKWDIAGLTQGLGVKLAEHGILVNGIAPGVVATGMQPHYVKQADNLFYPGNPLGRFALPEEIAELAIFMMTDASNFLVGQTIVCDGGYSLK
jgi:NAD(P)-dependent dehydrogenase (short-subunit alcohol dehydrogenase family)